MLKHYKTKLILKKHIDYLIPAVVKREKSSYSFIFSPFYLLLYY